MAASPILSNPVHHPLPNNPKGQPTESMSIKLPPHTKLPLPATNQAQFPAAQECTELPFPAQECSTNNIKPLPTRKISPPTSKAHPQEFTKEPLPTPLAHPPPIKPAPQEHPDILELAQEYTKVELVLASTKAAPAEAQQLTKQEAQQLTKQAPINQAAQESTNQEHTKQAATNPISQELTNPPHTDPQLAQLEPLAQLELLA